MPAGAIVDNPKAIVRPRRRRHRSRRMRRPSRAPVVAAVAVAAKVALVALRVADGSGRTLASPLTPLVMIGEDAWLVLVFAAAEAALVRLGRVGPRASLVAGATSTALFAAVVAWTALNVPIARVFSTPSTFSMLNASGGAISDSIAVYLTAANLGVPAALMALAALLARASARRTALVRSPPATTRAAHGVAASLPRSACLGALLLVALAGARWQHAVSTLGLHRNAVTTLARTTFDHLRLEHGGTPGTASSSGLAGCAARDGASADLRDLRRTAAGRNVVWVILESTAARFLTAYGATREVTPHLSALAHDAVIFDHAYAAYPESIKGLFSMLCARPPLPGREAAAHAQARSPCDALPARLEAAGYRTALFHSGRFAYLGMRDVIADRGFDVLEDGATIGGQFRSSFGVDEASTVRKLLAYVDGLPAHHPFFAVYSPIAGHHPYHAPGNGPRPFAERSPADAYANDLFVSDAAFGELRAGLQRRGLDERTLYVIVGDHGEAFFEHEGNFAHAMFLYEENVRVPFVIAAPGSWRGTRRAPQLASLIDVAPTVLDLLGLLEPDAATPARGSAGQLGEAGRDRDRAGHSLLDPGPRLVRFFTDQGLTLAALRDGRWKLIAEQPSGRAHLFDLATDPGERQDLAAVDPDRAARYASCLDARGG